MNKKPTKRQRVHKIIVGALRETIRAHGIINKKLIGSAAKRITGILITREKEDE